VLVGTKKTAAADKPAHKKVDSVGNIIDWDSFPAILRGMKTVAEYNAFRDSVGAKGAPYVEFANGRFHSSFIWQIKTAASR
jgi:hypothetical protein